MIAPTSPRTLHSFIEASPIPLTLTSPVFEDCPIVLCNAPFLELTGYSREEVLGRNCRFLQGPRTDPKARGALRYAIENQCEALVPITNYRKDGSEFENFVFILPIFDQAGALQYILGSQCDVTASLGHLSPMEHAQMLDQGIEIANPLLSVNEHMRIGASKPLASAMRTVLTGEMFD